MPVSIHPVLTATPETQTDAEGHVLEFEIRHAYTVAGRAMLIVSPEAATYASVSLNLRSDVSTTPVAADALRSIITVARRIGVTKLATSMTGPEPYLVEAVTTVGFSAVSESDAELVLDLLDEAS